MTEIVNVVNATATKEDKLKLISLVEEEHDIWIVPYAGKKAYTAAFERIVEEMSTAERIFTVKDTKYIWQSLRGSYVMNVTANKSFNADFKAKMTFLGTVFDTNKKIKKPDELKPQRPIKAAESEEESEDEDELIPEPIVEKRKIPMYSKPWLDERYQSAGTYMFVNSKLLKKLRAQKVGDLSELAQCIKGFGFVWSYSYEERLSSYVSKNEELAKEPNKMIPIRVWTPLNKLPEFAFNCGMAGYVDEFALHVIADKLGLDLLTTPGTTPTSLDFFNFFAKRMAEGKDYQNELKKSLLDALLNGEYVEGRVTCLACGNIFLTASGVYAHLKEGRCSNTKDPYEEFKKAESEQLKRHFPTDRTFDDNEPPTKKAHEQLEPELPKSIRDYGPEQTRIGKQALDQLTKIFENRGSEAIDRSDVESIGNLLGRNGEKSDNLSDLRTSALLEELKKRMDIQ